MTGVLARRGYNIQSLAVGNSETADLSRITTVIPGSKESSTKVIKQLLKLIHIHSVTDLSDLPFITRELMLIKCRCKPSERKELIDLAEIFHGNVCDISRTTITLEMTGKESKMRAVQDLISPYGRLLSCRTCTFCILFHCPSRVLMTICGLSALSCACLFLCDTAAHLKYHHAWLCMACFNRSCMLGAGRTARSCLARKPCVYKLLF